ncbi:MULTISPECIES: hypothetical protein [Streptococcus]|jgi:hypothetical protein|uniref:WXG100 family type VII secretion target n=2 Tax=Streptococcus sanguinis TaxID=1305 RepID=F3UWS0_STRSA|nr:MULTISPECIES: hypothetical protein [Streptococcus]EGF21700.1 hypothetical protein HMPREF9395_0890 [Streptococcus sanguinis SK1058]EGJ39760.1 hypothetical protein HMPREF9380_0958 [Streptococcus sanguinis SK49]EGJ44825.1 hypothetical protein HMPREF9396_0355 [Streptococcus sanguinis SK1059]EGQ21563.1 hypothetical protein HMPREF8573_0349 [Streptococcus sanguinis ATCC 29667]EGQ25080.1 hypothetical protein HMPREF9387_0907 [Streptococcus sanguinis SK340]
MNTNINDIQDRYTAETVQYESSNIAAVLENLKAAVTLIETTIPSNISAMESSESLWSGKAKEQYLGLKDFLKQYQGDFSSSVKELKTAVEGLETLLNSTSQANVKKEIDNG